MTGERILVVDDGADIRETITKYILKPNAYDYLEAKDGLEAIELLKKVTPDLILLDLQMPRLDGVGFLHKLREYNIAVPVVLMTMYGSEEIAIEVFRLGVRNYIIKPFSEDELLEAIEQALTERRLREERDNLTAQLMAANDNLAQQVQDLKILAEVGRALVTTSTTSALAVRALEAVMQVVRPQSARLLLVAEDEQSLICLARTGVGGGVEVLGTPLDDSLAWEVIQANEPRVGGAEYDDTVQEFTVPLAVPMYVGGTVGALVITTLAEPLSEHQVTFLSSLAVYTAAGLEQIRLLSRLGTRS